MHQSPRRILQASLVLIAFTCALTPAADAGSIPTVASQPVTGAEPAAPPLVVQSPGTVEIEIKIEPTAQTRELRVFADSGAFYRSTTIGLEGAASQRIHTFEWHGFPAGEYDVVGELISTSGDRQVVVRGALLVLE